MFSRRNFALVKETSFIPNCEFHFFPDVGYEQLIMQPWFGMFQNEKWEQSPLKTISLRETTYELWQFILCSYPEQNQTEISVGETLRVTSVLFACLWFNFQLENIPLMETSPSTVKGCKLKAPWPFCTERLLPCHTCCDTGSLFLKSPPKDQVRDWIVVAIFKLY